jgi:hypothetical protein
MTKIDITILKALIRSNHMYEYMDLFDVNNKFVSIYPFTTENIKGYLDLMDIKDKDVLTVGASGDQTLNLLVRDAKSVDYFDMNPFTKMYFNLKCAAIKVLNVDEYFEFFCYDAFPSTFKNNNNAFSINIYRRISPHLDTITRHFWDSLYLKQNGLDIRKSMLFSTDEESFNVIPKVNDYLSEESFEKLRAIMSIKKEPRFIETNIIKLSSKLTKKYDYILLSNIAQYLDYIYDKDELIKFRRLILNLSNDLNPNGKLMLSYLYDTEEDTPWNENYAAIYNLKKVREVFIEENLELINFNAITDLKWQSQTDRKDAALIYTKKN